MPGTLPPLPACGPVCSMRPSMRPSMPGTLPPLPAAYVEAAYVEAARDDSASVQSVRQNSRARSLSAHARPHAQYCAAERLPVPPPATATATQASRCDNTGINRDLLRPQTHPQTHPHSHPRNHPQIHPQTHPQTQQEDASSAQAGLSTTSSGAAASKRARKQREHAHAQRIAVVVGPLQSGAGQTSSGAAAVCKRAREQAHAQRSAGETAAAAAPISSAVQRGTGARIHPAALGGNTPPPKRRDVEASSSAEFVLGNDSAAVAPPARKMQPAPACALAVGAPAVTGITRDAALQIACSRGSSDDFMSSDDGDFVSSDGGKGPQRAPCKGAHRQQRAPGRFGSETAAARSLADDARGIDTRSQLDGLHGGLLGSETAAARSLADDAKGIDTRSQLDSLCVGRLGSETAAASSLADDTRVIDTLDGLRGGRLGSETAAARSLADDTSTTAPAAAPGVTAQYAGAVRVAVTAYDRLLRAGAHAPGEGTDAAACSDGARSQRVTAVPHKKTHAALGGRARSAPSGSGLRAAPGRAASAPGTRIGESGARSGTRTSRLSGRGRCAGPVTGHMTVSAPLPCSTSELQPAGLQSQVAPCSAASAAARVHVSPLWVGAQGSSVGITGVPGPSRSPAVCDAASHFESDDDFM